MVGVLEGKRAVITGASRGIGAAIAERFAAEGASLGLVARAAGEHPEPFGSLDRTLELCRAYGAAAEVVTADLADADQRSELIPRLTALLGGPIDILVNNAAATTFEPILEMSLQTRRSIFETNLHAPIDLIQAITPSMINRGQGWIVNLGSATAQFDQGTPGQPPDPGGLPSSLGTYAASKSALIRLNHALAEELRGTGVRINCIAPRAAALTEAMDAQLGPDGDRSHFEPLETIVEAVLALATCGEQVTGGTLQSLALLAASGIVPKTLDGRSDYPGRLPA